MLRNLFQDNEILYFENFDLENIFTPVDPHQLAVELNRTKFDVQRTKKLVEGFTNGFDLGYRNSSKVKMTSRNLRLVVGSTTELWNKVMKEVQAKRFAGPYAVLPYEEDFIQSPIGLVPKDGGTKTRLIFHLSHPRNGDQLSVNSATPEEFSKVKYQDIDSAIRLCIQEGVEAYGGKSDLTAAFCQLPIRKQFWRYLLLKAKSPLDGRFYYFVDKCLPFGATISCALFQEFSDALSHIVKTYTKKSNVNYLDDFFFVQKWKIYCDYQKSQFHQLCERINLPISSEKTQWGSKQIVFLGLLLDLARQLILVPADKVHRAIDAINYVLSK